MTEQGAPLKLYNPQETDIASLKSGEVEDKSDLKVHNDGDDAS